MWTYIMVCARSLYRRYVGFFPVGALCSLSPVLEKNSLVDQNFELRITTAPIFSCVWYMLTTPDHLLLAYQTLYVPERYQLKLSEKYRV